MGASEAAITTDEAPPSFAEASGWCGRSSAAPHLRRPAVPRRRRSSASPRSASLYVRGRLRPRRAQRGPRRRAASSRSQLARHRPRRPLATSSWRRDPGLVLQLPRLVASLIVRAACGRRSRCAPTSGWRCVVQRRHLRRRWRVVGPGHAAPSLSLAIPPRARSIGFSIGVAVGPPRPARPPARRRDRRPLRRPLGHAARWSRSS